MGKIVKYCTVCEESFAEKFSFCPNCAAKLNTFEMSPIGAEAKVEETLSSFETTENFTTAAPTQDSYDLEPERPAILSNANFETSDDILGIDKVEEPTVSFIDEPTVSMPTVSYINEPVVTAPAISFNEEITQEPVVAAPTESFKEEVIEEPVVTAPMISAVEVPPTTRISAKTPVYQQTTTSFADEKRTPNKKLGDDGFYSVTMVDQQGSSIRRMLLMGAFLFVMGGAIVSVVASIYNADAFVGSLEDNLNNIVYVPSDEPTEIEPEPKEIKKEDKEAGGGGGGNKDPNPVSKGKLADELKSPDVPPSVKLHQMDSELKLNVGVKSNEDKRRPPSDEPYGLPNSKHTVASDGDGSGGGQGRGRNGGQGDGEGPGFMYGKGGGPGGNGPGGPGSRRGSDDEPPPAIKTPTPRPTPVGPTEGIKILAKPRANYTDAARQNQVQGTVTLRVTFMANGSVGSITAVSGLPNGLTEQAIAAARGIRFEPAKVNGQAQTVTKNVQYSFTLY